MVSYRYIQQGTGQIFANAVPAVWVGTDGAVTCIAIYCQVVGQGVFVAHADCGRQVLGPGADFDYVRDTIAGLLLAALGAYNGAVHVDLQMFTGGGDQACLALQAGLQQWAVHAAVPVRGQDGFRVNTDCTGMNSCPRFGCTSRYQWTIEF